MGNEKKFLYHLRDTIVLLGGKISMADLLITSNDIKEEDINRLRNYNIELLETTKRKLVNINKIAINVGSG